MTFTKKVSNAKNLYKSRRDKLLDQLKHLYFEQKKSLKKIYQETGISPSTIKRVFKDNGLKIRTRSEAIKIGRSNGII
jgi:AraC-like DNA-binding protein